MPNPLIEVEIFWDGDGWYYAHPGSSERLGGPFLGMHLAWKQADGEGYEVVRAQLSRGKREYRRSVAETGGKTNAQKEADYVEYMAAMEDSIAKGKEKPEEKT